MPGDSEADAKRYGALDPMDDEPTEDERKFGADAWIYCSSHLRPHATGWCTVSVEDKIRLDAATYEDAVKECRARGLRIYGDS